MSYDLIRPETIQTGVIFASPHSGSDYPEDLRARTVLDGLALRSSEDAFVDRLIAAAPSLGAPLLLARTPRAYVDLNRSADELDPAVVDGVRRTARNPRVTSGLGVIPRVVSNGQPIYSGKLTLDEAHRRLNTHWYPYHAALQRLLHEQRAQFGLSVLIDFHSMPHEAIEGLSGGRREVPEVVLGDRFGAAAGGDIVDRIEAAFVAEGLRVARNSPFAGAFISQRYGRPSQNQHVVQIEMDRALYMDEALIAPRDDFPAFCALITRVMTEIAHIGRPKEQEQAVAAE
ncbi:N-formylglutamate amidohydrolase [Pseudoruegeria sp. SK021]|uniref:N-formylglutamate amidohydrolase n=1 Tax=Pseudoruegeria sp. SK021 TaxID=1933035 RepID=UPI000A266775|nr:N-formylglutamate amidohydrolase [Pseudoruegeria sp. SK021]OSP55018.1 N-formylglutamate amidohydrolase [Pseudoruegeria sp. SK021]